MGRSVLIVDDHAGFRACLRCLLEEEGFVVVGEVHDGSSAVAAARELAPDAVVLDVQLPDFDGFEVAKRLSSDGAPPTVVLVSTRDMSDYGNLTELPGVAGFISKGELTGAALARLLQ
jgi:DNA-binding NarL/FixJ family response regulator